MVLTWRTHMQVLSAGRTFRFPTRQSHASRQMRFLLCFPVGAKSPCRCRIPFGALILGLVPTSLETNGCLILPANSSTNSKLAFEFFGFMATAFAVFPERLYRCGLVLLLFYGELQVELKMFQTMLIRPSVPRLKGWLIVWFESAFR